VLDPRELYTLEPDAPTLERPVLIHALNGYVDAGEAVHLTTENFLETLDHQVVARFDTDQLHDYRARRPLMIFNADHWESYAEPELLLHAVTDTAGTRFLLLTGPEPDVQWERYVAAVTALVEHFGVRLVVGLNAIPMAVPHTRPVGVTAHASRQELIPDNEPWSQRVQVPASAGHLLEFRLAARSLDAVGFAAHVPHYLAQTQYPTASERLLASISAATGLMFDATNLHASSAAAQTEIDKQVADSSEAMALVSALEQQYDAYARGRGSGLLASESGGLPTAEEIGAELERFLAERTRRRDDD